MSIVDKLHTIEENVPKVYESGYNEGFEAGKAEGGGSGIIENSYTKNNRCASGAVGLVGTTASEWGEMFSEVHAIYGYAIPSDCTTLTLTGTMLSNPWGGSSNLNILFVTNYAVNGGIGAANANDIEVTPSSHDEVSHYGYTITVPSGRNIDGVYISVDNRIGTPLMWNGEAPDFYNKRYDEGYGDGHDAGYDEGHDDGKEEGVAQYTDAFWDMYQSYGTRTDYTKAFYQWTDCFALDLFHPNYDIKPTGSCDNMFFKCNYWNKKGENPVDLVAELEKDGVTLDFSGVTGTFNELFTWSFFTRLGVLDFSNTSEQFYLTFQSCSNLVTIDKLIINENSTFVKPFIQASKLENITIEGTIGQNGLSFVSSKSLTHDSAMSVINALKDYSADPNRPVRKVQFSSTTLANLSEEEKDIALRKGWTLA